MCAFHLCSTFHVMFFFIISVWEYIYTHAHTHSPLNHMNNLHFKIYYNRKVTVISTKLITILFVLYFDQINASIRDLFLKTKIILTSNFWTAYLFSSAKKFWFGAMKKSWSSGVKREKYYNSFVAQGVEYVLAQVNQIKVLTKNN